MRCTGKPAPSAAWPETLTAPGTAQSAPDTFQPPRGGSVCTRWTNICLLFILGVFAEPTSFLCVNGVTHRHTWALSVHLQCVVAVRFQCFCSVFSLVSLTSDVYWFINKHSAPHTIVIILDFMMIRYNEDMTQYCRHTISLIVIIIFISSSI